ncbi:MAG TPA: YfhO family protein [Streptosporangiaceae bacterium]|nr:YfhO family protein [Streptosporangiaceae bacterium]
MRAAVAATVAWSLWEVRATVLGVGYRDDSALHEQMVRFALARLQAGHNPLTSWFPYLGLGSPQFLHYQSTPAILTGVAGLAVGPDTAFRWSLYLLWCLWPVAIYFSARLLGLRPLAATLAAVVAPLLHSVPGIGYEQNAYLWAGFGVWTQLWGSWALPFAWALTWRAMTDKRFIAPAAALVAVTAAFHFETGYLAFGAILIMPFCDWAHLRARLARAAVLLTTALIASAWVIVPLLAYSRWAAVNQALAAGPSANGYGARLTLGWLITGRLLDAGHLPVVSLLAAVGLAAAVARWRRPAGPERAGPERAGPERALVAMLCACLLLSFGRTTFGPLINVVPGHADLFFRRFLMGSQLAAIYLAGLGGEAVAARARQLSWLRRVPATALAAAAIVYLVPAWRYSDAYDAANAAGINAERLAGSQDAPQLAALASLLRHAGGRVYAGSPRDWGQYFTVGGVPMYQYLASLDLDEVGYTLRTASLMSQPENNFDAANAGNYSLFGVRYLVVPAGQGAASAPLPSGAMPVLRTSLFAVYELPASSYFQVGDTIGSVAADRADIGSQTLPYLRSALPGQHRYLGVGYAGDHAPAPTSPVPTSPVPTSPVPTALPPAGSAGGVLTSRPDLTDGTASATVRLRRRAVVVLSASFDPGWNVTVDGHPATTQMVAPALVGVAVPAGEHRLTFRYSGFSGYPELLSLAAGALLAVCWRSLRRLNE